MDKKYQIFVSSTFTDLKEERSAVAKAILDLGHIPIGMEMFPASSTEQFSYIKNVIDQCDYYVIIIAAKYGSTNVEGISFTELEFDYAVLQGKQILAFIHENPEKLPTEKTDGNDLARQKLEVFRERVKSDQLVKFWSDNDGLASKVIVSLTHAFRDFPQVGWVRGGGEDASGLRDELLDAKREIERLRQTQAKLEPTQKIEIIDPVGLDSIWTITGGRKYSSSTGAPSSFSVEMQLVEFLQAMAISLLTGCTWLAAKSRMESHISATRYKGAEVRLDRQPIESALIQLYALDIVTMTTGPDINNTANHVWFKLTAAGKKLWLEKSYKSTKE